MNRRIFAGIVLFALLCAMLTGCGGREKVDLNGAASLADLRGATLGAQTGTFHLQALEQVESVTKKDYADFTDLLNALRSGAIDGYVAEEPTALEVCGKDDTLTYLPFRNNENGFTATDEETGIAAAFRTGSDMTAQVNAILADIPQQTRQELMAQIVAMSADPDTSAPRRRCSTPPAARKTAFPHRHGMRLRAVQLDADHAGQRRRPHSGSGRHVRERL